MSLFAKNRVFIIAELSANHNGSIEIAKKTIKSAKSCGADAIKLQTYTADTLTINSTEDDFLIKQGTIWDGSTLYDLFDKAYTPWEWHKELFDYANEIGITIFSSPFDTSAVDLLEELNVPAYKIASFEITDIPLIEYVASKQKTIIISTGIARKEDIDRALDACYRMGNRDIVLMKCTSSYPAPLEEANLLMLKDFSERFGVIVGLSDHTMGIQAPVVATALGAKVIEKHFILDKAVGGPDASFSLDENEFREMVKAVRTTEIIMGRVDYRLSPKQLKSREHSRSLYITNDIKKGTIFSKNNVRSIRPGFGLHPRYLPSILGKYASRDCQKGERFSLEMIAE